MKKNLSISFVIAALFIGIGCKKENNSQVNEACNNLPHTASPTGLTGNWASGYVSFTEVVDTYDGHHVGNAWSSGKFFKFTDDWLAAEFYYMAESQFTQAATKATGTIEFTAGSDSETGSFTFHPCWAHYKSYGTTTVDRDATSAELNSLTVTYSYMMDGAWLRIQPNGPVNDFSSSFRIVN
ncbi:MAG: hypothetical protein ABIN36_08370 [Ferruginibacter sp.]